MYKTLLVPLDGSATAQLALDEALVLARLSGATVQLLHIVDAMEHITGFEPPAVHIGDIRPRFLQAGQQILEQAAALLQAQGVAVHTTLLESRGERVSELIAAQATRLGADLIVLGTHGRRGVDRLLIGSDAEQLARIAPVPVLLVRERRAA
jgi:nucleotide-binding universal stress UspA family protein